MSRSLLLCASLALFTPFAFSVDARAQNKPSNGRPPGMSASDFCVGCKGVVSKLEQQLGGSFGEVEVVAAVDELCAREPKRGMLEREILQGIMPPGLLKACEFLMGEHQEALEHLFMQSSTPENREHTFCVEITEACVPTQDEEQQAATRFGSVVHLFHARKLLNSNVLGEEFAVLNVEGLWAAWEADAHKAFVFLTQQASKKLGFPVQRMFYEDRREVRPRNMKRIRNQPTLLCTNGEELPPEDEEAVN